MPTGRLNNTEEPALSYQWQVNQRRPSEREAARSAHPGQSREEYVFLPVLPAASSSAGLFLVSSSGLLIVVGVVRDMFMNIEAELKLHGYQEKLLIN